MLKDNDLIYIFYKIIKNINKTHYTLVLQTKFKSFHTNSLS